MFVWNLDIYLTLIQVVDDAEAQYLAFFAGKTIAMIRAPDQYVYPPPFNLVEMVFVAPFELVTPSTDTMKSLMKWQICSFQKELCKGAHPSSLNTKF